MRGKPIYATFNGQRLSVAEIAKATGLGRDLIRKRIASGEQLDAPRNTPYNRPMMLLEFRGRLATVPEIAAETGIKLSTAYRRHNGKTYFEGSRRSVLTLTFNGVTDTTGGWAKRTGLKQGAIIQRIRRGWPVEKIVTTPALRASHWVKYTFKGETRTLVQWAKRAGISKRLLYERIHLFGWPIERALTESPQDYRLRRRRGRTIRRMAAGFGPSAPADLPPPQPTGGQSQTFAEPSATGRPNTKNDLLGDAP